MNRLLLVSSGLGAVLTFVERDPKKLRLTFIPTAGNVSKDPWWVDKDRKALRKLGFQFSEFDIVRKTANELEEELTKTDIVYVAGGNTFYLLGMMQQCDFEQRIRPFLSMGKQYIGGSAGAVVTGPDIEPVRDLDDIHEAAMPTSTKGLGLVNYVVIPHQNQLGQEKITRIQKEFGNKYNLVPINDDQAISVNEDGGWNLVNSIQI